jgi:phosphoadenosine phosphosulfate reductase
MDGRDIMLIITERHTKKDLNIWKEYEEIDYINAKSFKLSNKEQISREEILSFATNPCYIGVSWGKDSVVTADIALRAGFNIPLVHLYCVPSHNIECDKVRDAFMKIYPSVRYEEIVVDYGDIYARNLATNDQDRLTDIEWYDGFRRAGRLFGYRHISGVRSQESNIRKLRMKRWGMSTVNTCAPIGYWNESDVFAYLEKYKLPVHPSYAMLGGGRWDREKIRVAEIGDIHGTGGGRSEWEREYYPDVLARIQSHKLKKIHI